MIYVAINEKLEEIQKSAYWLAKQTGIKHATLAQIRNNKNKAINLEYLESICLALECHPGDILRMAHDRSAKASRKGRKETTKSKR